METYYIKKGRKYVPVGIDGPRMYDGIWLVQSTAGSVSYKNLRIRISELPDCHDLQILAKATLLEDIITDEMNKAWDKDGRASFSEVAQKIVGRVATQEGKLTTKKLRGS